eukprot:COSAG02_NODE_378_length_23535_cov_35.310164_5_plen_60_part_00
MGILVLVSRSIAMHLRVACASDRGRAGAGRGISDHATLEYTTSTVLLDLVLFIVQIDYV